MSDTRPPVDPAELLVHASRLRGLARHLVGDETSADDVTQQALIAAIERPPRPETALGPWLVGVVRNLARRSQRAHQRRDRHEAAAAVPTSRIAAPDEIAARAEAFRNLVEAVHALDPIQRDVIVLHYLDGHSTAETARRLGVPVETARTRLRRALATLRARLDAKHGRREAWALALVGRAAVPSGPPRAPTATTTASEASSILGGVVGGALVTKKLCVVVVALLLLVAAGWYTLRTPPGDVDAGRGSSSDHAEVASAVATPRTERVRRSSDDPGASLPPGAPATGAAAEPTRWILRGRLASFEQDASDPAAVAAYAGHEGLTELPVPHRSDAVGDRFDIDVTDTMAALRRPGSFLVTVRHPNYLRASASVDVPGSVTPDAEGVATLDCVVPMTRAATLSVHVVDETGGAVEGARVGAFVVAAGAPDEYPTDTTAVSDGTGAVRLRIATGLPHLVAATLTGYVPSTVTVSESESAATIVMRRGVAIAGRVTREGRALRGATLHALLEGYGERTLRLGTEEVYWQRGQLYPTTVAATTDAEGRYRIEGLTVGRYRVQVTTTDPGARCVGFSRPVRAPANGVDFEVATATVVVFVRSNGVLVEGVMLFGLAEAGTEIVSSNEQGRAEVRVAPDREYQIQAHCEGFRETFVRFTSPVAGGQEVVTIDLPPLPPRGTLVVQVRDPDGRPIERSSLALFREGDSPSVPAHRAWFDKGGRATVSDAEPGEYRLVVRAGRSFDPDFTWDGEAGTWLDVVTRVEVPATGEREVTVTAVRGGRMRIAARDAAGRLVPALCEIRGPAGHLIESLLVARHGTQGAYSGQFGVLDSQDVSELAEALAPGRYHVAVRPAANGVGKTVSAVVEAGKTCTVEIRLDDVGEPPRSTEVAPAGPR